MERHMQDTHYYRQVGKAWCKTYNLRGERNATPGRK